MGNKYLKDFGYREKDINTIKKIKILKTYKEDSILLKIELINNYLLKYYSKNEIIRITSIFPEIYGYSLETLDKKIEDLKTLGYIEVDLLKMIKEFPNLLGYDIESIKSKFLNLMCLTYTKDQIIKMTKYLPQLIGYKDE